MVEKPFVRLGSSARSAAALAIGTLVRSLRADKAPYVVTLFVAALGWTALRTSDRLSNFPFVEYSFSEDSANTAAVRLRNVTSGQTFHCFIVEQVTQGKFGADVDQRVIYWGSVAADVKLAYAGGMNWRWEIKNFMPGADVSLGAPWKKQAQLKVLVRPCEMSLGYTNGKEQEGGGKPGLTPVLIGRSVVTWYVEHELGVLWSGLVAWLFALIGLNALQQTPAASRRTRRMRRSLSRSDP